MKVQIYHNPRCSKSRQMLALLQERNLDLEIIDYLSCPPDLKQLKKIISLLGMSARTLLRSGQSEFKQLGLEDENLSDEKLLDAMISHPILIERPIVVHGQRARIGRPPEAVLEIL